MKKKLLFLFIILMFCSLCLLSSCDLFDGDKGDDPTDPQVDTYRISYTYENVDYVIVVKSGENYKMEHVEEPDGWSTFKGLFDAPVGGTQYVTPSGDSVSAFKDNCDMQLYAQFDRVEVLLSLDYQEAPQSGPTEIRIKYGEQIPILPIDLQIENKVFCGWYTKPNCQGEQIADAKGILEGKGTVNTSNFSNLASSNSLVLYAGFSTSQYEVKLFYDINDADNFKTLGIEFGTTMFELSQIAGRIDGLIVSKWAIKDNGQFFPYNGVIDKDLELYACEKSPYIEFDANGGSSVPMIIAQSGAIIQLPFSSKSGATFVGWIDSNGRKYTNTVMPSSGIKLKAVWSKKGYFTRTTNYKITDSGVGNQPYDQLNLKSKFGYSISDLLKMGYSKITFSFSLTISEINDGYQEWYLSPNRDGSSAIGYNNNVEHGSGNKDSSSWAHYFSVTVDLSKCTDVMYLSYGAHGNLDDDWYCRSMTMTVSIS